MTVRFRRRSPMQDAFDGLCEADAQRLRAFLDQMPKFPGTTNVAAIVQQDRAVVMTDTPRKRGRRA